MGLGSAIESRVRRVGWPSSLDQIFMLELPGLRPETALYERAMLIVLAIWRGGISVGHVDGEMRPRRGGVHRGTMS